MAGNKSMASRTTRSTKIDSLQLVEELDESLDGQAEQIPSGRDKCVKCGRKSHVDDLEGIKTKQSMSKKKSQKHKSRGYQWISCANCSKWYHYVCSGLEQYEYYLYEKFHCEDCIEEVGPSVEYMNIAPHRYRWYLEKERKNKEVEVGTEKWIEGFIKKESKLPKPNDSEVVHCKDGHDFKTKFEQEGGASKWTKVFLVDKLDGLDMVMPKKDEFDLEDVVNIMGHNSEVDTIDVFNQNTFSMKLSTFLKKYHDSEPRKRLYNFLSLEFSGNQQMRQIVKAPKFVRDISMIDRLWPERGSEAYQRAKQMSEHLPDEEQRPRVEEFCLAGMAGSYTDFHIDFGGSSVYYHILKGQKIFYIGAPTDKNLKAFQEHECTKKTHEWFGNKIKGSIKRVVIDEGQTLLVPAGWIHAVLTPIDSLVFGGNFLHLGNAEMQLKVYQLENVIRSVVNSDEKFFFPNFEYVHWLYIQNVMLEALKEANDEGTDMTENDGTTWQAAKFIVVEMRKWYDRDGMMKRNKMEEKDYLEKGQLLQSFEVQVKRQEKINAGKPRKNKRKCPEQQRDAIDEKKKRTMRKKE